MKEGKDVLIPQKRETRSQTTKKKEEKKEAAEEESHEEEDSQLNQNTNHY